MEPTERISLPEAEALIEAAFHAQGASRLAAAATARALTAAEAEGQFGHGFVRVEDYLAQMRTGKIDARAEVATRSLGASSVLVDAAHGFAYPALDIAIEAGAAAALETGCAAMGVVRSHHCGALSVQVDKLAQRGLLGLMVANAPAAMAPWGGAQLMFGTNPIAFAAPRAGTTPLVIDLSLSKVARGKVMAARKAGRAIPEGWALDKQGAPTTDPDAALAGAMVPAGEAKGAALALMVEVLAAAMTGAAFSRDASSFFAAEGPPPGVGQFLIAMRPMDGDGFAERLETLLGAIETMEGARLPGARRAAAIAAARESGVDVPTRLLEIARAAAQGLATHG